MGIQVLQMVLPVLVMLLLGRLCSAWAIFDSRGLQGIKNLIGSILLPVVLFNAFFYATYQWSTVIIFIVIYCGYAIAVCAGFALQKLATPYQRYFPLLLCGAEGGMLGYALFGILTGSQSGFATVDMGQTVFAYTIFLATLKNRGQQVLSRRDLLRNMMTNKCFLGMALGILLGATGVSRLLIQTQISDVFQSLLSFITAPTSALVLVVVGYELNLNQKILKPVIKTVLSRLLVMGALFLVVRFVLFAIVGSSKELTLSLMVLYALPAPFIIPLFVDVGNDAEYISTTLSLQTICTVLLFIGIATFQLYA